METEKKKKSPLKIILIVVAVLVVLVLLIALLSGGSEEDYGDDSYGDSYDTTGEYSDDYPEDGYDDNASSAASSSNASGNLPLGSCGELEGTTLIVTILANDNAQCTFAEDGSDNQVIDYAFSNYKIATDWLTKQAAAYNKSASFVYDFKSNDDLLYNCDFACDLLNTNDGDVESVFDFVESNIDGNGLLSKYGADNVLYCVIVNSPLSATETSYTLTYEGDGSTDEFCFMFMGCDDQVENPASFAHEFMHAFGAPDLYKADNGGDNFGITQEYVSKLESESSNDIMFTTFDAQTQENYLDHIDNEMTELDAYYIGLTDHSDVVDEWGFSPSQHK